MPKPPVARRQWLAAVKNRFSNLMRFLIHLDEVCLNRTRALIYITLTIFVLSQLAASASPKVTTRLPSNSVAVSDDALASFFNPAGLGTRRGFNLYYLRSYQSDPVGDDAFFVSTARAGFGMEFANAGNDINFNRYTLSSGGRLSGSLYWGTGYSWVNSDDEDYDKLSSWSLGLMFRRRYLSVGAIGRDLNRPRFRGQKLGRIYDLGIALRPSTSRITFSIDARKVEDIDGLNFSCALEVRPINGFTLRGNLNEDSSFDLRFGFNVGQMGLGTYNRFDEVGKHQEGVGYFHLSQALHTTRYTRRDIFLDLRMGQIEKNAQSGETRSRGCGGVNQSRRQRLRARTFTRDARCHPRFPIGGKEGNLLHDKRLDRELLVGIRVGSDCASPVGRGAIDWVAIGGFILQRRIGQSWNSSRFRTYWRL